MKRNFENEHGVAFDDIQEQDLIQEVKPDDLKEQLKNAEPINNHYQQTV